MPGHEAAPAYGDLARMVRIFETLTPASIGDLRTIYAPEAFFADPFQSVQGIAAIERVFRHMFDTLDEPRFVITGSVQQGPQCVLLWDFRFRFRGFRRHVAQSVPGASHLRLDDQGRITHHQDYWDAAHGLYQQMPVLGPLMRWLRNRINNA
jgi:SnoaL-like domain